MVILLDFDRSRKPTKTTCRFNVEKIEFSQDEGRLKQFMMIQQEIKARTRIWKVCLKLQVTKKVLGYNL